MNLNRILRLALVLSSVLPTIAVGAAAPARTEDRLWIECKINGQSARFIFDTGTSGACLFPDSARRLGVKFQFPDEPGILPSSRAVPAGIAEECDFTLLGQTIKMQFNVIDLLNTDLTGADGILGWGMFKKGIFYIEAERNTVALLAEVPEKAKSWKKFFLQPDIRIAILEIPENGITNQVLLDTGAAGGLALTPKMWRAWKTSHPAHRLTLTEAYLPAAGPFLREISWAQKFAVGPLTLKEVPIYEAHPVQIRSSTSIASIGLRAMRQLQIVIDKEQGAAYVHAYDRKPEPYEHNRLGAVFIPSDPNNENNLVAHVASDSPAQRAGIQNGDVLLKIGALDVTKLQTNPAISSLDRFWTQPPGTEHRLTLRCGQQTNEVTVKLENILGPDKP